jgi:RNA polymerase sigma factor (sigma-70 family)
VSRESLDVQRVLDGDTLDGMAIDTQARDEFVTRVSACPGIVQKVARAYCWSDADREDLVQDILTQAWRSYPSYDPARPFSTWLYRVALNVAISWVRTHAPRQRVTVSFDLDVHDVGLAPFDSVAAERVNALTREIRQLEPLDRALVLLYLDDHTHREIAGVLGLSDTNVATKLHRLKQRLRQRLESCA